jgi:SAM-dependent methyltransferase
MIEKARSVAPEIDWQEGNATALSFADRSFDVILCQEMLQFVPDRMAALREVRRVLAPGGRFIVSTWRPRREQKLYEAMGAVAERHLGAPNDKRFCLDGNELRALLTEAGFVDVHVETVSLTEEYREFPVRLNAMASNFDLTPLDADELERRLAAVEADSREVLAGFAVDGGFRARSFANIATASSLAG